MPKVLLVGASSQICRGWLALSSVLGEFQIFYLSRSPYVSGLKHEGHLGTLSTHEFNGNSFDLVVNFVGASNQKTILADTGHLQQAMQLADGISLELARKGAHYVYLSSGAVYRDLPGDGAPPSPWIPESFYAQEKLRAELEHIKESKNNRIADLRVFGYLDKPRDALSGSLIGDLWAAYDAGEAVSLRADGVLRDIASPKDSALALDTIVSMGATGFHDLYTKSPASSIELAESLGLEVNYLTDPDFANSPTGSKKNYFSLSRSLGELGYSPQGSTVEVVKKAFEQTKRH